MTKEPTMMHRLKPFLPLLALLGLLLALGLTGCGKKAQDADIETGTETTPPPAITEPVVEPEPEIPLVDEQATPEEVTAPQLRLQPVFFAFDKFALDERARGILNANGRLLRDAPDAKITIEGHCDERGTAQYNLALGEKRARVAKDYLVDLGIAAARIEIVSYGKERPFNTGHDETAWAANRRAHFVQRGAGR